MSSFSSTPLQEIPAIHNTLANSFNSGKLRPLTYRRTQLSQFALLIQENHEAFLATLAKDMGKPALEATMGELAPLVDRAIYAMKRLEEWCAPVKPEVLPMFAPLDPTILKQPRGVVLVVGPYNYPLLLVLQPLIGAIAAGCAAVIKPSDLSVHTSALLGQLFPKYLDQESYRVVNGGAEQVNKLLELKWNCIFYTGGKSAARIVATAAAKHLTPVTLELGGKSPVIVDAAYGLEIAAKRILYGKIQNAGQICVAPDYMIAPRS
ncbi:ALDH-like protein [Ramaria rubella]|nr:ALDH-like protein [Ramaria rubella]